MPLITGQTLQNRYRVVSLLGEGGMGAVYRAWDLRLEKPVALKEMVPQPGLDAPTLEQFRTQFRQEAIILGKLAHPHLVQVTDYFEEQGNDYLVMAFVEGKSLADRIRREGALPEAQVVEWARQLLDALVYCHERGVIHRDIKPQNVVVTPEGRAVLVDFGLVKLWDPADPRTRTVMRGVGTPEYAPPEQWGVQDHHTDPRSDLYSLGATLYHALTGQAPPTASDRMVYPKKFKTPRELNSNLSPHMDGVISRAMTLAIDDRWPDARAMAQALTPEAEPSAHAEPVREPVPDSTPVDAVASVTKLFPTEAPWVSEAVVATPEPTKVGSSVTSEPPKTARPRRGSVPLWRWVVGGIVLLASLVGVAIMSGGLTTLWPVATKTTSASGSTVTPGRVVVQPTRTTAAPAVVQSPDTPGPTTRVHRVGMVTSAGGIDDKSYNATAWQGVELAIKELGIDGSYLESQQQADYSENITQYLTQDVDLIVTVGFQLADDTASFAESNPDVSFAIVDLAYEPPIDNIRGLTFATDQAAFVAGYAAAAATRTGKVACFGGMNIPPVSMFMVGYEAGVRYYNEQQGTNVEVLGWDTATNEGVFVDNFESTDDGRRTGEEFLAQGADIIMPVAGPVGQGTAEAVTAAGNAWIIGVDTDWTVSAPTYKDVILTSVVKNMDIAVFDTISLVSSSAFTGFGGETYVGTLGNGGVGLTDVAAGAIPADIEHELEDVRQGIIDGTIDTGWATYLANLSAWGDS